MDQIEETHELNLEVRGMTCDSCAVHVERALRRVPGVREAAVPGWKSGRARVVAEGGINPSALLASVAEAGYTATVRGTGPAPNASLTEPRNHADDGVKPAQGRDGKHNGGGDFDLMVIGHGSAGFAAAIKGAELGARVALVGSGRIGGTCVNVGCVPSKTIIRAMEQVRQAGDRRFRGVQTMAGRIDWPEVIGHKDELVNDMRQKKYIDVLEAYPEITYLEGWARLTGLNGVEIAGKRYTPGKIVIATGASPWAPPLPGLAEVGYLDSTSALDLKELPRSMIVLGGNAVGLELAQVYARAGSQVTVAELLPRIAPFEDEDVSAALTEYLEQEGLRIVPGFETAKVTRRDGRFSVTGTKNGAEVVLEAEQILVATGRRPNTADMGLDEAGVRLGARGEVLVNEFLQTHNPFVYAAGDVTGRDMFVYVASYGGMLAVENALAGAARVYDTSDIPRVTFTDPQVASAGLTESQARERYLQVRVTSLPMSVVPRAQAARDTRGLVKLVADDATNRLLGIHILAPEAGEMIQAAVLAMRFGITLTQLRETMFPYLTNAEALKLAVLSFEKDVAKLSCCAG